MPLCLESCTVRYWLRAAKMRMCPRISLLVLLVLAAAAMLVGTTAALRQKNVKRLLALSGVANAGYMLVPIGISITVVHSSNFSEFVYYLAAYLFMTIGAFAVLTVASSASGNEEMRSFAGMYYRAPWTAAAMVIFMVAVRAADIRRVFRQTLYSAGRLQVPRPTGSRRLWLPAT